MKRPHLSPANVLVADKFATGGGVSVAPSRLGIQGALVRVSATVPGVPGAESMNNQIAMSKIMSFKTTVLSLIAAVLGHGAASAATVWSDKFNGSAIDTSTWTYDVSGGGFGNGQFEFATARRENSYVTNGNLVMETRSVAIVLPAGCCRARWNAHCVNALSMFESR